MRKTVPSYPTEAEIRELTIVKPDSPAPHIQAMVEREGSELTREAFNAWANRVKGVPVVDIAHSMGLSIEMVKTLIKEAREAVGEDLKESMATNRELDLERLDGLIRYWYPSALQGDEVASNVILKCIAQRGKLTGNELPDPGRTREPANVLVWIQNQLPTISRLVDSLPVE